jgi:transposase-like protein
MLKLENKTYSDEFKFKVAMTAIHGEKTVAEICSEYCIVSSQLYTWKNILEQNGHELFADKRRMENKNQDELKQLTADIEIKDEEIRFLECVLKNSTQKRA